MRLVHHEIDGGFLMIPNEQVDDPVLEMGARGLLTVFARHKSGWDITLKDIERKYAIGREALATLMGQLQVTNHIVKFRTQDTDTGHWSTMIVVSTRAMSDDEVKKHQEMLENQRDISGVQYVEPTDAAFVWYEKRIAKLDL